METRSFWTHFFEGDSPMRLIQGLTVGVIATLVVGFGVAGWHLDSTVEQKVEDATRVATVAALAPICADRFQQATNADRELAGNLAAVGTWQRDNYLMDAGWATFAGGGKPDSDVAEACADMLSTKLKLN